MDGRQPPARLHRHMAAMVALEQLIEHQIDALLDGVLESGIDTMRIEALLTRLRESALANDRR
jgi:hypothetical protein